MIKGFEFENKFNTDNAFTSIKFGYDRNILETELNEMQEIQNFNRKSLIHKICKSGIIDLVDRDFTAKKIVFNPNGERNKIAIAPMRAIINGHELHIKGNYIVYNDDLSQTDGYVDIDLGEAPRGLDLYTQYRQDLVYLQMWFEEISETTDTKRYGKFDGESIENTVVDNRVGEETSHRIGLKWKIVTKHDVDFDKWEYGFGYNAFNDYSNIRADIVNDINATSDDDRIFVNATHLTFKGCSFYGDNNLWVAGRPNKENASNTKDTQLVFAVPLFRIIRRNQQPYSLNNPNGSIDYNNKPKNLRPDGKCYDMIYETDFVDLRKNVIINNNDIQYYLDNTMSLMFNGQLTTKQNNKMRRLQFGVQPTPLTTPNLIFSDSFNINSNPELGNPPLVTNRDGFSSKYIPSVTKWGLKIDGNISLDYNIKELDSEKNINPNQGTIEFFITPRWNSFDNTNQLIFVLKDNAGHPFISMEKNKNQIILRRYHSYVIPNVMDNPTPEIIYLNSSQSPLLSNKIYHMRIVWNANSSLSSNIFAIYINGQFVAQTVAYDMQTLMEVTKLQIGKIESEVKDNTGFVIDELNIYNKCLSNNQWNLPEDYLRGDAVIMPSFNGLFRNYRDNKYEQKNVIIYKTISNGNTFSIDAPYNTIFGSEIPKIYCLKKSDSSPSTLDEGQEIIGNWTGLNTNKLTFNLTNDIPLFLNFSGEKISIEYSVILQSENHLDDIPNEILKSEIYNYSDNTANEVSFNIENNTEEINSPREVPMLLTTTINKFNSNYSGRRYLFDMKDSAYDFSTLRNIENEDFSFVRLLEYYVTGNGTNEINNIPNTIYGYKVLYIRNIYYLNNTVSAEEIPLNILSVNKIIDSVDPLKSTYSIKLDKVIQNGDKLRVEIALGGLTFDYNNISKTFVGNVCKADFLEFTTTGDKYIYTIPLNNISIEGLCSNGNILALAKNNKYDSNGMIESTKYICYRNNSLYQYEYIDGINKSFLKIRVSRLVDGVEAQLPVGENIQIPLFFTYQPNSENILSIWYNYTPYQGILSDKTKKVKRLSNWKYFITTYSSAYTNDKFNKVYSISNLINRLPGGLSGSTMITGQDIELKGHNLSSYNMTDDYSLNKKIIFIDQNYIGNINDDIDKYFFNLDTEYSINKIHGSLQDDLININNKDFKIYLPVCESPINKYCGMASIVMDEYGDLYLFIIGDTNNNVASVNNSISPKNGDLFIIPYRPNLINRS